MTTAVRYLRLFVLFAQTCLIRELSFRVNFIARIATNVGWLALMVLYFQLIFANTHRVGDWDRWQYLFFMGTGMILNGILETVFVGNCSNMSELIRTGDLDLHLARPVDEQFLLSCRNIDWSEIFNVFVGIGLCVVSLMWTGERPSFDRMLLFLATLAASVSILYSLLLVLAASSVWLVRNQALYELWWYVAQFGRYPGEIYKGSALALGLKALLTFVLPVLLAINIPARQGFADKATNGWLVLYLFFAAAVALALSRMFFKRALRSYRSASS
jgi:ABC-2 type transport system permease protein